MTASQPTPKGAKLLCYCGPLVRSNLLTGLLPTNYGADDLAEWRQGGAVARRKTPLGYFGHPAAGNAQLGQRSAEELARRQTEVVHARLVSGQGRLA